MDNNQRQTSHDMSDYFAIYQLNAQSADKLDERRDATTSTHGSLCIAVATAAVGTLVPYPTVAAVLWAFLIVIALGWLATFKALTAKLTAKNKLLTSMEGDGLVPFAFLTEERKTWDSLKSKPLQSALKHAPIAFLVLGSAGFLSTLLAFAVPAVCP